MNKGTIVSFVTIFGFVSACAAAFFLANRKGKEKTGAEAEAEAEAEEGEKDLGRKRVGSNEDDSVYSDWVGPVDDDRSSIASSNGGSKSKRRSKKNSRKQPKKRKTKSKK